MPKILVVEDSVEVRENLIDLLEINNYEVIWAENGAKGFSAAKNELPDLIISDIMMPVLSGHELIKLLRDDTLTSHIPVIFLTAKASMSDLRQGMSLGADDYIAKPFEAKEILQSIATRLERKKGIEEKYQYVSESISSYIPHELRTPITAISGFSSIIQNEIDVISKEEIVDLTKKIGQSTARLSQIIEKFISFSESEYLRNNRYQNAALLRETSEINPSFIAYFFQAKKELLQSPIKLQILVETAVLKISEYHLLKIVNELMENAIKFSNNSTSVHINSTIQEKKYILTITNYGRGMAESEIKSSAPLNQHNRKVFEQGGNGLGLAIVKNLCEFNECKFNLSSDGSSYTEAKLEFLLANEEE